MSERQTDEKLAELLLLLAEALKDQRAAGATKLNKLAFFAEFAHVRATGHPITGVTYQRLPNGPAPRRLMPVRQLLIDRGDAELHVEPFLGRVQHRLVPRRPADRTKFSASELETVDEVIAAFAGHTGTSLSELSHAEPAWDLVDEGETIPYEAAFLRRGQPGERALQRARELATHYGQ
jgi:hypothetical protein